tara:strand:+ start:27 stop:602 length:576 start_codon:yes stop_codon:yes gene_type:complete
MKKSIESYLPLFPGFYNTIFESHSEGYEIESYNEENDTDYNYNDFTWHYDDYHNNMSQECCSGIEEILEEIGFDIKVKFQKLVSPKFYNFTSDSINCEYEITQHEYNKVIDYIKSNWSAFEKHIKETYSSRDGFISSHSNNAETWMNNIKSESHLEHNFGSVLDFILENEEYTYNNLYETITDTYVGYELI